MDFNEWLRDFAANVRATTSADALVGTLVRDRLASRGDVDVPWPLIDEPGAGVAFHRPEPTAPMPDEQLDGLLPCYSFGVGDVAAVTGLVFARFRETDTALQYRDDFARLGFDVERDVPQQPQTIWLKPTSARPADGIRQFAALSALPGLEHAELQLLRPNVLRGRGPVPGPPTPPPGS